MWKGFSGNPYHDTKKIFNYIYKKTSPVISTIDSGINKFNNVYKNVINPVMNEYNGPHAERLKFANTHLGKAVNEYDNLRTMVLRSK